MSKIIFPATYFNSEKRCNFYITSMVKRLWAAQLEVLSWIDEVCRKYGIRYIMCYGSLIGTVRHKGYIPWDDDIDIGMLRADYNRFLEVLPVEIPPYLHTVSLLPGAYEPREMIFNINTGRKIDTSPQYLERFHGCPYATGVDVFVFDRVPDDPEEFKYQDRLVRMLDRMLVLQWKVDEHTTSKEILQEYHKITNNLKTELDFTFTDDEPRTRQILRLMDLACSICEDCGSTHVENMEQVIYYGEKNFREEHFTDRIWVPYEGVMDVPIPRSYDDILSNIFGDYKMPRQFTSQHEYPIYYNQRIALYKEYKRRGWQIPEEFLEYDENGKLLVDPDNMGE